MADYQGLIRIGVQGLGQVRQLNTELRSTTELLGNVENALLIAGQIGQSSQRNVSAAERRRAAAGRDLTAAQRTVANTAMRRDPATGLFLPGGPNATARRLASANLRLAQREVRESSRNLRQELRNRRLIYAAEQRYARQLDETTEALGRTQDAISNTQDAVDIALRGIGRESRENYLTNLFRGRQREFARGGGGAGLSPELQQQARNARAAFDLALQSRNPALMQRLATEQSGLVREQNEGNRLRSGRSTAFESARRAQERIDELAARPGVDNARIRRLRARAGRVIQASQRGDIAGARDLTRRLKASIDRYVRELDAAATDLANQRRAGIRNLNVRQSWAVALEQFTDYAREQARQALQGRVETNIGLSQAGRQASNFGFGSAGDPVAKSIRRNQEKRAIAEAKLAVIAEAEAKAREALLARVQKNIDLSQAGRQVSNFGFGLAGDPVAKSIRRNQERRAAAEAKLAAIVEAEAEARQALRTRVQANLDITQASREASNFGFGLGGDAIAKSIRRNQEKRAAAEAKLAAIAEAEAKAREEILARVQANANLSQAGREASNFGFGLAGDPVAKSIRRNQEKRAIAEAKLAAIAEAEAKAREALLARIQRNLDLSQAGRQASNFGFGSAGDPVAKSIERNRRKVEAETRREALAQTKLANQSSARGRAAELRRTQGLSFEERLARLRPDLAPGGQKTAPGLFRGDVRKALGEGLIGGAFPLLFGQGAAASAGGLVGGFAGGAIGGSFGFGLSLIGTALGQAVDATSNNLKELASSLKSPNDAIAALEASGFRVGDSLKSQVEQLQSVGRAYDAQTLVLQEVQKRLGPGAITELNQLDTAQKRLQEQWAAISAEIQTRLLPVLQGFVEFLGSAAQDIGGFASQSRLQRLDPQTFERLRTQAIRETSRGPFNTLGNKGLYDARLNELSRQELSRRFAGERAQVPLKPQEALADEKTRIDESRRLADQIQSAYREAFKLQRQAHDLQREGAMINKEIADYAYKKESEIFALRQQALEKQIENTRAAAQNRIEGGDLSLREAFATATGFEQQLLGNVREAMRSRKEGEADIEQSRRKLELTMAKLNRDTEDYKRTTAREIEDIERRKLAYMRSVEDYRRSTADYVLQRSREAADLMLQASQVPDVGGGGAMGGSNANVIANSLINRLNLTPAQAAGVVGNFMRESGANINPRINEGGAVGLPAGRGGYGIAQWTGSRQSDLVRFAGSLERAGDLGVQIDFLIKELRTGEAGALRSLRTARTPEEAARVFEQGFERSGVKALAERQRNARQFFNSFVPGAAGMPSSVIARTGATGIGTGAHLDVRWADGRPITSADADRFIRVAGKVPSSFGVSSGYGPRKAPIAGASTFHRGIDFPTPAGLPISLTGGARLTGSITEAQSGGGGIVGIIDTPMGQMKLLHLEKIIGNVQAGAAMQISSVPVPGFNPVPIGPTPEAAPINAQREALRRTIGAGEQEAQKILEQRIKLRQKGIELGQLEAILQSNQLPQLEQQGDALSRQIEARRQILDLSDDAASVSDIQAEREARLAQILKDRQNALDKVQKRITDPKERDEATRSINRQASAAIGVAVGEEEQRLKNLKLSNQLQNEDRARLEILQLEEGLAAAKVEAAALERGELQASNVELFKASQLYQNAEESQRDKIASLLAETEELRKQNEFRRRMNEGQRDIGLVGAGLRAGFVGTGARAFEQGLRDFPGDTGKAMQFASQAKAAEDAQLMWGRLEQNIVDVSEAISGGLTNGLLDIIDGSRKIEDVGRGVLRSMANTFAESAQQQLSTLMQRKLGGMLGGPEGMLTRLVGGGAEATGAQALGSASLAAAGQVAFFGATLQSVAAQAALSGGFAGVGPSLLGSAIPNLIPGFAPGMFSFGGFFANGGVTTPNKGYVVGDGGEPEFFFPGVTGRVVPRSDMEKAAALRERGGDSETIDLRYETTEVRGERYVTEKQFRRSHAMLLARSQAMSYSGMRNNKEVREFVGI